LHIAGRGESDIDIAGCRKAVKDDSNGGNARKSSKRGNSQSAGSVIGGMRGKHEKLGQYARFSTSNRSC
jgi:hypothetical protein